MLDTDKPESNTEAHIRPHRRALQLLIPPGTLSPSRTRTSTPTLTLIPTPTLTPALTLTSSSPCSAMSFRSPMRVLLLAAGDRNELNEFSGGAAGGGSTAADGCVAGAAGLASGSGFTSLAGAESVAATPH